MMSSPAKAVKKILAAFQETLEKVSITRIPDHPHIGRFEKIEK
jgi:hypothetical protein